MITIATILQASSTLIRNSLGVLSLYRHCNLDFCVGMIFNRHCQRYHHNLKIVTHLLHHLNCVKYRILWRANGYNLFSYDCKLANYDLNHKELVTLGLPFNPLSHNY